MNTLIPYHAREKKNEKKKKKKHGKNVKVRIHYGMITWYLNWKVNIEGLRW